jgi:hypothetical protein
MNGKQKTPTKKKTAPVPAHETLQEVASLLRRLAGVIDMQAFGLRSVSQQLHKKQARTGRTRRASR